MVVEKRAPGCLGYIGDIRGLYCPVIWGLIIHPFNSEVADLSPINVREQTTTDGTRVWVNLCIHRPPIENLQKDGGLVKGIIPKGTFIISKLMNDAKLTRSII